MRQDRPSRGGAVPGNAGRSPRVRRRSTLFDRLLGSDFLDGVPSVPGIYRVFDEGDALVYVGKAKNLRRRLAQYRNASRRKRHAKMRAIVRAARRVEVATCSSHLAACLLEARLIQEHRPRFNVAGAFHFLYPFIGLRDREGDLGLCYATQPDRFPEYALHGAYRSRAATREAYWACVDLLRYLVPAERRGAEPVPRYSFVRVFRRLAAEWTAPLTAFFRGEDVGALGRLAIALLAKPAARCHAADVEANLAVLRRFWDDEVEPLARACTGTGYPTWPVAQADRDPLFLRARYGAQERVA
jgi:excinuclease ABC subunit C